MALTVKPSKIHGKGLFTTDHIPQHAVVCEVGVVRQVTPSAPLDPASGEMFHHCRWLPDGTQLLIDEPYCYMNHCCDPSTFYYTVNRHPYLVSTRQLDPGDEITTNYCYANAGHPEPVEEEMWHCSCGSPNCRGTFQFGFRYMDALDQASALPYIDPMFAGHEADLVEKAIRSQLASR